MCRSIDKFIGANYHNPYKDFEYFLHVRGSNSTVTSKLIVLLNRFVKSNKNLVKFNKKFKVVKTDSLKKEKYKLESFRAIDIRYIVDNTRRLHIVLFEIMKFLWIIKQRDDSVTLPDCKHSMAMLIKELEYFTPFEKKTINRFNKMRNILVHRPLEFVENAFTVDIALDYITEIKKLQNVISAIEDRFFERLRAVASREIENMNSAKRIDI